MLIIIDNYDSFVYNIVQYISEFEKDIKVYRNDKITIDKIKNLAPDAIIISPGPKRPEDSNISIDVVKEFYNKIPILGVCLGHQVIGYVFGATVSNAKKIVHGKKSQIVHNNDPLFNGVPQKFEAGRYHSLAVLEENLPYDKFEIIAYEKDDKEIMGIKLKNYPVYGLQFHPESILTSYGRTILYNFYKIYSSGGIKMKEILQKITSHQDLSEEEAYNIMSKIMKGNLSDAEIAGYLIGLKTKGETVDEIVGSVKAIREAMVKLEIEQQPLIDTCGTGGDGFHTFNISTTAALIAAGAGVYVAKHGNKGVSSKCGSADILADLGVKIDAPPDIVKKAIQDAHIGFIFAPLYHPAFKNVVPVRKALQIRTIFNMIGPIVNPAQAKRHSFGIFNPDLTEKFAKILKRTGFKKALVFSSEDGMDEISPFSDTKISYLFEDEIKTFIFSPEKFGLKCGKIEDLVIDSIDAGKKMITDILNNKQTNKTSFYAALLNGAAALFVANDTPEFEKGFKDCVEKARESIASLKALEALNKLIEITKD